MKALLFSGGVDSTALAFGLRPELLVFVDYGQRPARGELRAARAIARELALPLEEIAVDCSALGSGAMAGAEPLAGTPPEHWPYRNQLLITVTAMRLAARSPEALMLGSVRGDEQHSDGSAEFREAVSRVLAVQSGPRLEAPASHLSTEELVASFSVPDRVLGWTFSCHTGEWACGACRGCSKHRHVMDAVGFGAPRS